MGEIQRRGSSDPFSCVLWTNYDKGVTMLSMLSLGNFDAFKRSPLERVAHMEQGGDLWEFVCQSLEESGYFIGRMIIRVERAVQQLQIRKHQRLWRVFGVP